MPEAQQFVLPLVAVAVFFFQSLTRRWLSAALGRAVSCVLGLLCSAGKHSNCGGGASKFSSNSIPCFISISEMLRTVWRKRKTGTGCSGWSCCSGGDGRAALPSHSAEILTGEPSKLCPYAKSMFYFG